MRTFGGAVSKDRPRQLAGIFLGCSGNMISEAWLSGCQVRREPTAHSCPWLTRMLGMDRVECVAENVLVFENQQPKTIRKIADILDVETITVNHQHLDAASSVRNHAIRSDGGQFTAWPKTGAPVAAHTQSDIQSRARTNVAEHAVHED